MKFTKYGYLVLFACLIIVSCQDSNLGINSSAHQAVSSKSQLSSSTGHHLLSNSNIVSKQLAKQVALHFANNYRFNLKNIAKGKAIQNKKIATAVRRTKKIKRIVVLRGAKEKPLLYLINFTGGGFIIVSGDKRSKPVLAFSKHNKFPKYKKDSIPEGLSLWLQHRKAVIKKIRKSKNNPQVKPNTTIVKENSQKAIYAVWYKLGCPKPPLPKTKGQTVIPLCKAPPPPPPPGGGGGDCTPTVTQVGPLLQTTWAQGVGYNNFAPYMACSTTFNGRAWAGCVAVAIAQVMNYYEYPSGFNWNAMPMPGGRYDGNNAVSHLIHDIGLNVNMNYGCDVSLATANSAVIALHHYGYSDAQKVDFHFLQVKNILLYYGDPVILSGDNGTEGHMWVAGGFYQMNPCPGQVWVQNFYMNWGWGGSYNGWYDVFDPGHDGGSKFNHHKQAIIYIHPTE